MLGQLEALTATAAAACVCSMQLLADVREAWCTCAALQARPTASLRACVACVLQYSTDSEAALQARPTASLRARVLHVLK